MTTAKRILEILLSVLLSGVAGMTLAARDPNDKEGSQDPSIFSGTRMTGFYISRYDESDLERYEFPVGPGKTDTMEGHYYWVIYTANEGIKLPSGLQVIRNYTNAATAIGGEKIYEFEDGGVQNVVLKVIKGNTEVWAHITGGNWGNRYYNVYIVEKEGMTRNVVADAGRKTTSASPANPSNARVINTQTLTITGITGTQPFSPLTINAAPLTITGISAKSANAFSPVNITTMPLTITGIK